MFKKLILLWLLFSLSLFAKLPFEVEADHIKLVRKGAELYASGNVVVNYKQYSITSDDVAYQKATNELVLNGNISIYDQKNNQLFADKMTLFLDIDEGRVFNAHIQTNRDYIIKSSMILLKEDEIELKDCTITTCRSVRPEWYFKSDALFVNKKNNLINANKNTLYFYGFPVFYIPSFSQSVSDASLSNRPTPEFGYNQIDRTFFNVYLGYLLSDNVTGKAGVGTSEKRGFRYGATHIYAPQKNQSLTLKTYDVQKTGFEGGVSYRWRNDNDDSFQPLISALFIPSENKKINVLFSADYLYDTSYFNELYNSLPDIRLDVDGIPFYFGLDVSLSGSTGYFQDRVNKGNRHQLASRFGRDIFSIDQFLTVASDLHVKDNYYPDDHMYWRRLFSSTSFDFGFLNTKNILTYTKVLVNNGRSPFVFDTINEVSDDEFSTRSQISLLPLILSVDSDYQINNKSFRNFEYSLHWVFQCWQLDFSVNTVWEQVSFGISIPNF